MRKWHLLIVSLSFVAAVALPLGLYGGAYLALTEDSWHSLSGNSCITRRFRSDAELQLFYPAAKVEAWLCNDLVLLEGRSQFKDSDGQTFPIPATRLR